MRNLNWNDLAQYPHMTKAVEAFRKALSEGKNVLLIAPQGAGVTMLARRAVLDLGMMSTDEIAETSQVYRNARLVEENAVVDSRPFRAPHHTISEKGMRGVVRTVKIDEDGEQVEHTRVSPGEISLAHNGVLLLDEMLDFQHRSIEHVRNALRDGNVKLYHKGEHYTLPAKIRVVGSITPCLCYGEGTLRGCSCNARQKVLYEHRLKKYSDGIFDEVISFRKAC